MRSLWRLLVVVVLSIGLLTTGCARTEGQTAAPLSTPDPPVLAYYYQWFNERSWDRAKIDYPLLGRYDSDDANVIREHVRQAQQAGIDGFIVSWKHTELNDRRLRTLMGVARENQFKLAVIYQGLDFHRRPLPITRIHDDLRLFRDTFSADPVFHLFDKPLVLWSGSWSFSDADISSVTEELRPALLMLATEKQVDDYRSRAALFDGNAYYWSSVDPQTNTGYAAKLKAMGDAVRRNGGMWIAPFAPGFDARLVGGTRQIPRRNGQTLRAEYEAAAASEPDALGLISWNEFSENTHVEPSQVYGDSSLTDLRRLLAAAPTPATTLELESDAAGSGTLNGLLGTAVFLALLAVVVGYALHRRRSGGQGSARSAVALAPRAGRRPPGVSRLPLRTGWFIVGGVVVALVAVVTVVSVRTADPGAASPPSAFYRGPAPVRSADRVVVAAAGDIVCPAAARRRGDKELTGRNTCRMDDTAALGRSLNPDAVLALGDLQYPSGSLSDFNTAYDQSWGEFRSITYPVPGNHEYGIPQAAGYFSYFGERAGASEHGYYSFDLGAWHMVALNSECEHIGGCGPQDPQAQWLQQDLSAHANLCTLAFWHRPRFSSGSHGHNLEVDPLWRILAGAHADVILNGHDHDYERFAPLNVDGDHDEAGTTEYVVGTGGASHYHFHHPESTSQARVADRHGLLQLELEPSGWNWRFLSAPAADVLDEGSAQCR